MAWAVTDEGTATDITAALTVVLNIASGKDIASGSLVVVHIFDRSTGGLGSVADSKGNTYNLITSAFPAGSSANGNVGAYYSILTTGLTNAGTDKITYTKGVGGTTNAGMSVVAATGNASSSALDTAVTANATGTGTTPSVISGTPSVSGELMFEWVGTNGLNTITVDSGNGWASPPTSFSVTSCFGGGADQVNAGTGTKTAAPTLGTSRAWAIITFGFKPPAAGGSTTYNFNLPMLGM